MPLTDSIARNAKPAAKTIRIFDHDGLYLEVSPVGASGGGSNIATREKKSACRWASTRKSI